MRHIPCYGKPERQPNPSPVDEVRERIKARSKCVMEHPFSIRKRSNIGYLSLEEIEFIRAIDKYKLRYDRPCKKDAIFA